MPERKPRGPISIYGEDNTVILFSRLTPEQQQEYLELNGYMIEGSTAEREGNRPGANKNQRKNKRGGQKFF